MEQILHAHDTKSDDDEELLSVTEICGHHWRKWRNKIIKIGREWWNNNNDGFVYISFVSSDKNSLSEINNCISLAFCMFMLINRMVGINIHQRRSIQLIIEVDSKDCRWR